MSTHNLCFRAKIRKNVYPCTPQFYFIKVGCKGCTFHEHVCMMKQQAVWQNSYFHLTVNLLFLRLFIFAFLSSCIFLRPAGLD